MVLDTPNRPRPIAPPPNAPAATILLVEDDAPVRDTTQRLLESFGHRVLPAGTDEQALWLWERHRTEIDLVLSDLMIPTGSNGVELTRHFRAERPDIPVILTSGFGEDMWNEDSPFPARVPFLQKPVDPGTLRDVVQLVLDTARAARPGA